MYAPVQQMPPAPPAGWGVEGVVPACAPEQVELLAGPSNCPNGLEYLTQIDQLLVHQKVELLEAMTGFETANKYTIKNTMGQKIYRAAEDTDCCTRYCCGPMRPFSMKISDADGMQVLTLVRPLRCQACCYFCCLQEMEVFTSPAGDLLGSIKQKWSLCKPQFEVNDAAGNTVLRIEGPFCTYSICGDVEFKVKSESTGETVGKISKQWSGLVKEMYTDADNFGISFPLDLDVRMKAVLLGAVFLIDYMFFETADNKQNDGVGMTS